MSRAYRVTIKESLTREVKAGDEISTKLELLEILPPEEMAGLLRGELVARGFRENDDGTLSRADGGTSVTVDPCNGEVTVRAETSEQVELETRREGTAWDDAGPGADVVAGRLREHARADLEKQAEGEAARLQGKATEALEKELEDLQPEIAQVVNKVTRDALKQKAARLGTIMDITEDAESGSMTIKVEV